jgi:hypothetical protein
MPDGNVSFRVDRYRFETEEYNTVMITKFVGVCLEVEETEEP